MVTPITPPATARLARELLTLREACDSQPAHRFALLRHATNPTPFVHPADTPAFIAKLLRDPQTYLYIIMEREHGSRPANYHIELPHTGYKTSLNATTFPELIAALKGDS